MVSQYEKFVYRLTEIDMLWHKLAASSMKKHKLKGSLTIYLAMLLNTPGGLTASKMGELCSREKGDVARDLSSLMDKGLITRESNGGNRYRSKLILTEKGRAIAGEVCSVPTDFVAAAYEKLTDEEKEHLSSAFIKIRAELDAAVAKCQEEDPETEEDYII